MEYHQQFFSLLWSGWQIDQLKCDTMAFSIPEKRLSVGFLYLISKQRNSNFVQNRLICIPQK